MHCSENTGKRTIFDSEKTKAILDLLYVCVRDEEGLVSPQGGVGQAWVCRRWGSHISKGCLRTTELQHCYCFVVLCPFLQRRLFFQTFFSGAQ